MPGAAWTEAELDRLREMVADWHDDRTIAEHLGRTRDAVRVKRAKLGLCRPVHLPPYPPPPLDLGQTMPARAPVCVEAEAPITSPPPAARECAVGMQDCAPDVQSSSTLFALIGDTHFGSRHCAADELADFYRFAHERGVRDFCHTGDLVAGYHKKWRSELCEVTLDGQIDLAIEAIPRYPDARTRFVTGNHEDKAHRAVGIGVGAYIAQRFRAAGRTDVQFVGGNRAHVQLPSGKWLGLQHPGGGGGENLATSAYGYLRQDPRWAELSYYACGHWHKFDYGHRAHCHIWAVPCFEKSSIWGQSLRGGPDIGGIIVHDDGKNFGWTVRLY